MAGVLILILAIALQTRVNSIVGAEVIDIAAWVLLWEVADISLLQNRSLRWKKEHYLAYISMNIEYVPLNISL